MRRVLVGLVLIGCGGGSDDPPPAKAKTAKVATPDVTAEAPPPEPPGPAFAREVPHAGERIDDPKVARAIAIEEARNVGILGSTALTQRGAFASLTGTGDISSGLDDSTVYGGLVGNEVGEMSGGFGYGRSGFGPGGGGTGWGTIGTGRYGTIGHGAGTGSGGYGVGGGRGGMRGRAVPTVSVGAMTATGDLDKAIIRRYLKRNIAKVQYCYERELLADPKLAGTVVVSFAISGRGDVTGATASGVSTVVASCVADVVRAIVFPAPKDGATVDVAQPFTFRPASP